MNRKEGNTNEIWCTINRWCNYFMDVKVPWKVVQHCSYPWLKCSSGFRNVRVQNPERFGKKPSRLFLYFKFPHQSLSGFWYWTIPNFYGILTRDVTKSFYYYEVILCHLLCTMWLSYIRSIRKKYGHFVWIWIIYILFVWLCYLRLSPLIIVIGWFEIDM